MKQITKEEKARLIDAFLEWLPEQDDVIREDDIETQYQEMLNDEPVQIGSLEYDAAWVLQQIDETAYRCGLTDFMDGYYELPGGYYSEDFDEDSQWSSFFDECCSECPVCGSHYLDEDITNASGEFACPDCSRRECSGCGEFFALEDLEASDPNDGHSEVFCPDCRHS